MWIRTLLFDDGRGLGKIRRRRCQRNVIISTAWRKGAAECHRKRRNESYKAKGLRTPRVTAPPYLHERSIRSSWRPTSTALENKQADSTIHTTLARNESVTEIMAPTAIATMKWDSTMILSFMTNAQQAFRRRTRSVSRSGGAMLPTNHRLAGLLRIGSISYSNAICASASLS